MDDALARGRSERCVPRRRHMEVLRAPRRHGAQPQGRHAGPHIEAPLDLVPPAQAGGWREDEDAPQAEARGDRPGGRPAGQLPERHRAQRPEVLQGGPLRRALHVFRPSEGHGRDRSTRRRGLRDTEAICGGPLDVQGDAAGPVPAAGLGRQGLPAPGAARGLRLRRDADAGNVHALGQGLRFEAGLDARQLRLGGVEQGRPHHLQL
mmetsp:Transcript_39361/g.117791  ORF Transcript_39361/g.117791 Transcript_39361/m.117791 type:complete len:207 (-) Transcript_39361:870-1490(-)